MGLLTAWLAASAFAGEPGLPEVDVVWKGADGRLFVRAPSGEHIAPEAPVDLDVSIGPRSILLEGLGSDLADGLSLGEVRGAKIGGALDLSVCEDAGTTCRRVEVRVEGAAGPDKRGSVSLAVRPADEGSALEFPGKTDAQKAFDAALADAKRYDSPVLVEFGAVWCPPCNLLQAQLLYAEPRPSVVDAFVLTVLDVDDPTSWPLKDRFHIGGYPTMVALSPDGKEIGRMVGYPGVEDTVLWMDAVVTGRLVRHEGDPKPEAAARLAWRYVQEGRLDDARRMVQLAGVEPDRLDLRLARFRLDPSVADGRWLAEHAQGRAVDWVLFAEDAGRDDPALREVLQAAARDDLASATGAEAADLLALCAAIDPDAAQQRLLYGAAARMLQGELTGDVGQDKGHFGWLAWLYEHAGQDALARDVLERARVAYPDEPTFHTSLARMELRLRHYAEAVAAAEVALEHAWGDNQLTAATVKTEALVALGRVDEARAFVEATLAALPAPEDALDVRAHRYRQALRDLVPPEAD
jgi:tetratricopeptide (TPR) repeat protein